VDVGVPECDAHEKLRPGRVVGTLEVGLVREATRVALSIACVATQRATARGFNGCPSASDESGGGVLK
jgi:hypothetical protein